MKLRELVDSIETDERKLVISVNKLFLLQFKPVQNEYLPPAKPTPKYVPPPPPPPPPAPKPAVTLFFTYIH